MDKGFRDRIEGSYRSYGEDCRCRINWFRVPCARLTVSGEWLLGHNVRVFA